mmetsp:Transcript_120165/g.256437  ORF Transcript_120165/g.256437 Transcript_120165/m.256437 type:complete len:153 (+) Transcript_120165:96-554(+)
MAACAARGDRASPPAGGVATTTSSMRLLACCLVLTCMQAQAAGTVLFGGTGQPDGKLYRSLRRFGAFVPEPAPAPAPRGRAGGDLQEDESFSKDYLVDGEGPVSRRPPSQEPAPDEVRANDRRQGGPPLQDEDVFNKDYPVDGGGDGEHEQS